MNLGWSTSCCICGRTETSYHNPDPIRDGNENCCSNCNQLVVRARMKYRMLPEDQRAGYVLRLHTMTYDALIRELPPSDDPSSLP